MSSEQHAFFNDTNLASERLGAEILGCNDEFFAPASNLLKNEEPIWIEDKYTERGKWMDGWETQRLGTSRRGGFDWAIVHLGVRGVITGFSFDTKHFTGNFAPYVAVDGYNLDTWHISEGVRERRTEQAIMVLSKKTEWVEILPKQPLGPSNQFHFPIDNQNQWTHVRVRIFPDGGIARLKVHGKVKPDWNQVPKENIIDLAAVENGGEIVEWSDEHFGKARNVLMPGFGVGMFDGWEPARNRREGHVNEWLIAKLASPGSVFAVELDTSYFLGNFPDKGSLEGANIKEGETYSDAKWEIILPPTSLSPDKRHLFEKERLEGEGPYTHVRLNIFPDGGASRLRVFGVRL